MMNNMLSESDIEALLGDEEGRKALVKAILKFNFIAYCVAVKPETFWPYDEKLRDTIKIVKPHLLRIAEMRKK